MPRRQQETLIQMLVRRMSVIFDLDGVILESFARRYAVFLEVFARYSYLWPDAPPISLTAYRQRLGTVKHSAALLPLNTKGAEYEGVYALLKGAYDDVLREYRAAHIALNTILPGAQEAFQELVREHVYASIVSFRFMPPEDVVAELIRHRLVAAFDAPEGEGYSRGLVRPPSVNVVGSEHGAAVSKSRFIAEHYKEVIETSARLGSPTHLVGDALTDMQCAFALLERDLPVVFVGLTETGEANEQRFREEMERQRGNGLQLPQVHLFANLPAAMPYFREAAERHVRLVGPRLSA